MINLTTMNLREAYGLSLGELGKRDNSIVVLEADLGKSTRTVLFQEQFPDRFFEMGIAEQNMASTSAGFALCGKIPFINSFAVFAAGRTFDQLRNAICVPNLKVRICGSSAGFSDFGDGKTHQSVEDIVTMRSLPNMTVLAPSDAVEVVKMMELINDIKGPVYIRINRGDLPIITPENEPWELGKIWEVRKGKDAVIFANGIMVSKALEAAENLAKEGIDLKVLNVSTIKPINRDAVIAHSKGMRGIVTAEEGTILGGLGAAILESLRRERHAPVELIGVQDLFGISAKCYDDILGVYGLTCVNIEETVKSLLK